METLPDSSWRRTFHASVAAQFLCMIGFSFAFPFMPLFIREMGVDDAMEVRKWAGWAASASGFTMAIFAPIWGIVADRHGRKMMVLRSMVGATFIMVAMGFARRPEHLVLLRFLQGALSGTISANMALVASVTPADRTGYAMGIFYASAHAGRVLGPAIGGMVADRIGYGPAFWAGAAFTAVAAVLIKVFTREAPITPATARQNETSWKVLFGIAGFSVALLAMFQVMFAMNMAVPLFPLLVEALRGTSEKAATITGAIFGVTAFASVVSTGIMGRLGDKWGHRRMLMFCTAVTALLLGLHAFAQNVTHLFILRILLGLATAGIQPSASAMVRNLVPAQSIGKAFGIMQSVRSLGVGFGPLAGGYLSTLFEGTQGLQAPFLVTGIILLFVPFVMRERGPGRLQAAESRMPQEPVKSAKED